MTKPKTETEKAVRRPRRSLAERAREEYGKSAARHSRAEETLAKAREAEEIAKAAYDEAQEDLDFWAQHPAVKEMLDAIEEKNKEADES